MQKCPHALYPNPYVHCCWFHIQIILSTLESSAPCRIARTRCDHKEQKQVYDTTGLCPNSLMARGRTATMNTIVCPWMLIHGSVGGNILFCITHYAAGGSDAPVYMYMGSRRSRVWRVVLSVTVLELGAGEQQRHIVGYRYQ